MTPQLHRDADGVATIRLARPAHRNRLHGEDLHTLLAHFEALAREPARVLVLTGEGPVFCAGYHLGELDGANAADGPALFERTVDALEALPLPTVARLNGGVYGGATDLALACDFRLGLATMELRMPAARLGLHYYPNGLRRAVSRLGLAAAKRLFLLGETLDAAALLAMGWLDEVLPDVEALDAAVARHAATLAANAPLAVCGMKRSLDEIARGSWDAEALAARVAACAASEDLREGLAAFAARRAPRFQGR